LSQFNRKNVNIFNIASNKSGNNSKTNLVKFSNLFAPVGPPSLVLPKLFKEEISKSKFHGKNKGKNISQ